MFVNKTVLISGASFAGLSTAFWMIKFGYKVSVVEIASGLRKGGTPVDIKDQTVAIVERMGLLDKIKSNRLHGELTEFKNADDITVKSMQRQSDQAPPEYEIEREVLLEMLFDQVKGKAQFIFGTTIKALTENNEKVEVVLSNGARDSYDLVFGCDGMHSNVRRLFFGPETDYSYFLKQYFSITIVNKTMILPNTMQIYNEPGKAVMLNTYNGKTDIVLCFRTNNEIAYDYRDEAQQRKIILDQFSGVKWRTGEALAEIMKSPTFYFDKLGQIKMPSWTSGRIGLVGDAAYCASPAAGMGGSLAIIGAAALAESFEKHIGNFALAFRDYNTTLRPFIEQVQADAESFGLDILVPETEEAINERNARTDW